MILPPPKQCKNPWQSQLHLCPPAISYCFLHTFCISQDIIVATFIKVVFIYIYPHVNSVMLLPYYISIISM